MSKIRVSATRAPDEFYVGYLPLPAGIRRFTRAALIVLLAAAAVIAAMIGLA